MSMLHTSVEMIVCARSRIPSRSSSDRSYSMRTPARAMIIAALCSMERWIWREASARWATWPFRPKRTTRSIRPRSPAGSATSGWLATVQLDGDTATAVNVPIARSSPRTGRPPRARCPATAHRPAFAFTGVGANRRKLKRGRMAGNDDGTPRRLTVLTMRGPCCGAPLRLSFRQRDSQNEKQGARETPRPSGGD